MDDVDFFGDQDLSWVKTIDQINDEWDAEAQVAEDPNWDKGMDGYSEDEPSEQKRARKQAQRKRHAQESAIGAEEGDKLCPEEKKKREKKAETAPSTNIKEHGGMVLMTTEEGVDLTVALPDRLPNQEKHIVNRFGGFVWDSALSVKNRPHTMESHMAACHREGKDINSVVTAYRKNYNLDNYTVKLALARLTGSKTKAEEIVNTEKRHHLLHVLPPFKAFDPPCTDPALTGAPGDATRPLPLCLFKACVEDDLTMKGSAYPNLGGFESVSGIRPTEVTIEGGKTELRRVPLAGRKDGTLEPLFRFRSCYSDVSRLFWFKTDARTIATIHMLLDDLVPLSGVLHGVVGKPLRPVTEFFCAESFIRDLGTVPWNFGESRCVPFVDQPLVTVRRGLSERKADDVSHELCSQLCKAVAGILKVPLTSKELLFARSREPERPERRAEFPEQLLADFVAANPQLAEPLVHWVAKERESTEAGSLEVARDYRNLQDRYAAYLAGYLDWRYFMLPEMVLAALAIAHETIYPDASEDTVILGISNEREEISSLGRMCENRRGYKVPAVHIMFHYYRDTCFEKYAAALLLWNFIGNKKVFLEKLHAKRKKEAEERAAQWLTPGGKNARTNAPKRRFRAYTVAFEAVYDYHGRDIDTGSDMAKIDLVDYVAHIRENIDRVYAWNIHPSLCHKGALDLTTDVHAIDPTRLDSQQALLDRQDAEGRLVEEIRARRMEQPTEWEGQQEEVAKRAVRQGKAVASGYKFSFATLPDLEKALSIFNESFDVIKPTSRNRSMKGMHRFNFTAPRINTIIWKYMQESDLLKSSETNRKSIWMFTLTNRRDARGVEKYTRPRRLLMFSMRKGTPLSTWYFRSCHDPEELAKHGKQL